MAVQVPTGAAGGDDLLEPMQELMRGLSVLPTSEDLKKGSTQVALTGTPDSVSIIESGATALSKGYAVVITGLGGAAAVTTAVTGFWADEGTGVRIALLAGTAAFLTASVIAVAVIVAADVAARAAGSVAQYDARRHIAVTMLDLSLAARRPPSTLADAPGTAVPGTGGPIWSVATTGWPAQVVRPATGVVGTISGVRGGPGGVPQVRITRRDDGAVEWCAPEELELLENLFDQQEA